MSWNLLNINQEMSRFLFYLNLEVVIKLKYIGLYKIKSEYKCLRKKIDKRQIKKIEKIEFSSVKIDKGLICCVDGTGVSYRFEQLLWRVE